MSRPWMPFYVGDYLRDTVHLSALEHGAYCLLLFAYWARGGLPDDERQLANIAHLSAKQWRSHRATLQAFFYDGWKHKRLELELRKTSEKVAKRRVSGQKGGLTTALNREKQRWQLEKHR